MGEEQQSDAAEEIFCPLMFATHRHLLDRGYSGNGVEKYIDQEF